MGVKWGEIYLPPLSPAVTRAELIKAEDPEASSFFSGPCLTKKTEGGERHRPYRGASQIRLIMLK
ncbi:MAG TPA: hypothetical protein PKA10_10650 [Selenomonadales bacterium]|nr:hypothetical protein [Selenomonadales bacterium]